MPAAGSGVGHVAWARPDDLRPDPNSPLQGDDRRLQRSPLPRMSMPTDHPASGQRLPGPEPATTEARPLLPRALVVWLGMGAAVLVLAGVRSVAWLINPVVPALVVVITLSPAQAWARRRGWPAWLTTPVLLVIVFGVVLLFAPVLLVSVARLAAPLPPYRDQADRLLRNASAGLERFGVSEWLPPAREGA